MDQREEVGDDAADWRPGDAELRRIGPPHRYTGEKATKWATPTEAVPRIHLGAHLESS